MKKMIFGKGQKLSRRKFVVGSAAAAGGGLALGFKRCRSASARRAAQNGAATEVNIWVAIKPDDTCVIRIARSEMGQGTLTGLAQLVAEELECDWKKVTTEGITPGAQSRQQARLGRHGHRRQRAASARSQDYVRRGGAAARMMLLQAAADQWKVPVGELTVSDGIITHAASKRTTSYGKVAAAAAKLTAARSEDHQAQGSEGLEDRRQADEAARHRRQAQRQQGLRDRREAARHAQRRHQGLRRCSAARS